jgi:hypothetical protein
MKFSILNKVKLMLGCLFLVIGLVQGYSDLSSDGDQENDENLACLCLFEVHNHANGDCPICFEPLIGNISCLVPCLHQFHTQCLDDWCIARPICPMCEAVIINFLN